MKLIKIVNAYLAISKLMERKLNNKLSYALFILKKEIEPSYEYFALKESELISKYGKKNADGKTVINPEGTFDIDSSGSALAFKTEKQVLFDMEVDVSVKVRKVSAPDEIEGMFFEALDGFIEFEVDNDNS